jgi:putative Mg2+ transporter-C (MgtC) family protein
MSQEVEICLKTLLAFGLGAAVGIEREFWSKPAGLRTHILVCMSSGLITSVSFALVDDDSLEGALRLPAAILTGIGFIGAGTVLRRETEVTGLTTAATVFMAAAIGIAVGMGFFLVAVVATGLALVTALALLPVKQLVDQEGGGSPKAPARR